MNEFLEDKPSKTAQIQEGSVAQLRKTTDPQNHNFTSPQNRNDTKTQTSSDENKYRQLRILSLKQLSEFMSRSEKTSPTNSSKWSMHESAKEN